MSGSESSFRFPLPESLSFLSEAARPTGLRSKKKDGEADEDLTKISARLRQLCSEKKKSAATSTSSKTWSQLVVKKKGVLASSLQTGLGDVDASYVSSRPEDTSRDDLDRAMHGGEEAKKKLEALAVGAEKMVIRPHLGRKATKKMKKFEREKTKGDAWYGMGAPELTDESKRDLEVLQMRSALDPKRFYKKNDLKVLPKYFQVGQVVDSAADFYSDRIPNKLRKKTLVDELMADAEFKKYNKRKYAEIIERKEQTDRRHAAIAKKRRHMEAKRRKKAGKAEAE